MKIPDLEIGKRLTVGANAIPVTCFGVGPTEIRGTAAIQGPLLVGASQSFPIPNAPEASVMIARSTNPEAPVVPSILKVTSRGFPPTPIDVMIGDVTGPVGVTVFCGPMPFVVQSTSISMVTLANYSLISPTRFELGVSDDIGAKAFVGAKIELGFDTNVAVAFNNSPVVGDAPFTCPDWVFSGGSAVTTLGIANSKKPFDILHPTKDGYRLRYVSLEGPSAEVYFRGVLKETNIIKLPDYWKGLVDPETITVNLTPIGCFQELFYEQVEWCSKIKVVNSSGGPIHCSFTVYGERKDTSKNIPEYKGLTPNDYPGDNSEYRLN
jgi:hypothetical protein